MTQLHDKPTQTRSDVRPSSGDGRAARVSEVDAAQQSLADALRFGFTLLKLLMVLLVVGYFVVSGTTIVEEQQKVVKLRFGKIVGQPLEPGFHFTWPFPIEEKIWIEVASQQITLNNSFWFELSERDIGRTLDEMAAAMRPINPLRDGSLLTGDASVVHGQFQLTYRITDPVRYVEHIGDPALARDVVRNAAERGIIHAASRVNADNFIASRWGKEYAESQAQSVLDQMNSGITIMELSATATEMPLAVRSAYREVSNAQNERAQAIAQARQEYSRILVETAGAAHEPLYLLIQELEQAIELNDTDAEQALRDELTRSFTGLRMNDQRGGSEIGGEVAAALNRANTERSQIVQSVRADAARFEALLAEYRKNPGVVVNRIWEQARRRVLSSPGVETLYAPDGAENRLMVNPDPAVARQREMERLRAQEEAVQQPPVR